MIFITYGIFTQTDNWKSSQKEIVIYVQKGQVYNYVQNVTPEQPKMPFIIS
jgi:hypothetical protein